MKGTRVGVRDVEYAVRQEGVRVRGSDRQEARIE